MADNFGTTPYLPGQGGAAVLPYLSFGTVDPTVVGQSGTPGSLYLRIAPFGNFSQPIGLYQKITNDDADTDWVLISGGGSTPITDYKDPVDTIDDDVNIVLAAPGAVINGVTMAAGYSFLATSQTDPTENGIYDWNGAAVPATRRADANTSAEVTHGMFTWVDGNDGNEPTIANLTGWILTTPNPITLGVDSLSFAEIPIPASEQTAIDGLYFVAENGTDVAGTTGSIADPFLSIQAAIDQAVADGHDYFNQAEILVLPNTSGNEYAGFACTPGINVCGVYGDSVGVTVNTLTTFAPGASGLDSEQLTISNINFIVAGDNCIRTDAGTGPGRLNLRNCKAESTGGVTAILMQNPGGEVYADQVQMVSTGVGFANGFQVQEGFLRLFNNCTISAEGVCVFAQLPAGRVEILDGEYTCTGTSQTIIDLQAPGPQFVGNAFIQSTGTLNTAIAVRTGATAEVVNSELLVAAGELNYLVELGGTLIKNNIIIDGDPAVVVDGNFVTVDNSEKIVTERRVVSAPEAAASALELTRSPLRDSSDPTSSTTTVAAGGITQGLGADYEILGKSTLSWLALGMSLIPIVAGDVIVVGYQGSPRT